MEKWIDNYCFQHDFNHDLSTIINSMISNNLYGQGFIDKSLTWSNTPEGQSFWRDVNAKFNVIWTGDYVAKETTPEAITEADLQGLFGQLRAEERMHVDALDVRHAIVDFDIR